MAKAQYGGDFTPPHDPRKNKKKNEEKPPAQTSDGPGDPKGTDDTGNDGDLRREGRKVFSLPVPGEGEDMPGESGWAIVLETFKGTNAAAQAQLRLPEVSALLGRDDVSIRVREKGCAIVLGGYTSPKDERATRDLAMVRAKEVALPGGVPSRPYEMAFLAAPSSTDRGQMPEFDLSHQRKRLGNQPAFTVQIAVYDTPDKPADAKRAAEKAAKVLREAGEKAFYYHGPRRSMVTIGLFTGRDVDEKTGRPRTPEIARIRKDFPLNLLNGQYPIVMGGTGAAAGGSGNTAGKAVHQPSQIVKVP
ncbi:MAG: hypothetical protein ACKVZJ_00200 [Phycisphaerales bacterium]